VHKPLQTPQNRQRRIEVVRNTEFTVKFFITTDGLSQIRHDRVSRLAVLDLREAMTVVPGIHVLMVVYDPAGNPVASYQDGAISKQNIDAIIRSFTNREGTTDE
jgi:hypothetical protein